MSFWKNLFAARAHSNLLSALSADAPVQEIRKLLEAGGNVHERDEDGRTPLHMAVFNGSEEIVELLLSAGANPNAQDKKGVTALNTARSFNGLESICRMLIAAGADPDLKDNEGKIYNM